MPPTVSQIGSMQSLRRLVLLICCLGAGALGLVSASTWPEGRLMHEAIEWIGIVLIFICIAGRTWSSLYLGGRKIAELVTVGPYSVMRNPLYSFSIVGAAGGGAQLGSASLALLAGFATWAVFFLVVLREEALMGSLHGTAFDAYVARTPRFLPRWTTWNDVPTVQIQPLRVTTTFFDACIFLLTIPIAEGIEYLQESGVLPVLFRLP